MATWLDVSEAEELRENLQQQNIMFKNILDNIPIFIALMTLDGRLIEINADPLRIAGVNRSEVLGKSFCDTYWWTHSKDVQEQLKLAMSKAANGKTVRYDTSARVQDNRFITLDIMLSPVRNMDGEVLYLLASAVDISDRIAARKREKELSDSLQAFQRMEAVGLLAAGVAHDFNNILEVIFGYAQMLRDDLKSPHQDDLEEILVASRRGKELVSQLLAAAQRQPRTAHRLNISKTIEALLPSFSSIVPDNISLEFESSLEDAFAIADPIELDQILTNLVKNAAEADYTTKIFVRLTRETPAIDIRSQLDPGGLLNLSNALCLRVADNGCGMSRATQERIFEPFFRAKKRVEGRGMGLAVVKGTVQVLGGIIHVQSSIGIGSTFTIWIPEASSETNVREQKLKELDANDPLQLKGMNPLQRAR